MIDDELKNTLEDLSENNDELLDDQDAEADGHGSQDSEGEEAEEEEQIIKRFERYPLFNMRYIVVAALSGIIGIVLAVHCSVTSALMICGVIMALFLVYCLIFKEKKRGIIVFLVFATLFYIYGSSVKNSTYSNLPYEGAIQGVVRSEKALDDYCTLTISTKVYGKDVDVLVTVNDPEIAYKQGDIVSGILRLTPLEDKDNQHSYDYGLSSLSMGVDYRAHIIEGDITVLGQENGIMSIFYSLRRTMQDNLNSILPQEDAAMIGSMLLGGNDTMDDQSAQMFRDTGIAHIFSVSGLHVSIIANAVDFLLVKLRVKRRSRWWMIGLFLTAYGAITAFATSVVRASIMTTIMYLAGSRKTNYDPLCALGVAALVIMAINPFSIFSMGCQLSFLACFGIFSYNYVKHRESFLYKKAVGAFTTTISAQLATLPIMINSYGSISLIATLANIIIVPLASITLVGALALSLQALTVPYSSYLLITLYPFSQAVLFLTKLMAGFDYSSIAVNAMPVIGVIGYYVLYLATSRYYGVGWKVRLLTCIVIIVIFVGAVFGISVIRSDNSEIVFLSVGNGDCTIIRAGNEYYVIDGGPGDYYNIGFVNNDGYIALKDYLYAENVREINIIATHDDADHVGAIIKILNNNDISVNNFIYSPITCQENAMLYGAMSKSKKVTEAWAGDSIICDNSAEFRFIYPNHDTTIKTNTSLAFIFEFAGCRALFCGDNQIADSHYISLLDVDCDIMLLPHHGKDNAMSQELLEAAAPRIKIVSTGEDISLASGIYATSASGQISISIDNKGNYTVKEYKNDTQ